ncbi:hypothetical protein PALU110988_16470 [Paenibacillus lupini]|nr:hypothetical protein [Paenibacillus lupini]
MGRYKSGKDVLPQTLLRQIQQYIEERILRLIRRILSFFPCVTPGTGTQCRYGLGYTYDFRDPYHRKNDLLKSC